MSRSSRKSGQTIPARPARAGPSPSGASGAKPSRTSESGPSPAPVPLSLNSELLRQAEKWLAGRRLLVAMLILGAAVAIRAACYVELSAGPCFHLHKWDESDMHHFDQWARQIVAGDWLSQRIDIPMHAWHREVAVAHLRAIAASHGASLPAGAATETTPEQARAIWYQWLDPRQFYQDPLYPYLLAGVYKLVGPDVRYVFALQMLAGVLATLAAWRVASRCFGELAGVAAAVGFLAYGPLVFHEFVLLRDSLVASASIGLVYLLLIWWRHPSARLAFYCGLAAGVAVLLKSHFILFFLLALVAAAVRFRADVRTGGAVLLTLAAGFVLALAPLAARNFVVGAPLFALASGGGPTFILSNASDAGTLRWSTSQVAPIMAEFRGRLLDTIVRTLGTHPHAGSYLGLLADKLAMALMWYEWPNNVNIYHYRQYSSGLVWLGLSFGLISPLALLGVVLAARTRGCGPLLWMAATNLALLLLFFGVARFRIALAAVAIPLAAAGLVWLADRALSRRYALLAVAAVPLAAVCFWTLHPAEVLEPLVSRDDFTASYLAYYEPQLGSALAAGEFERAARVVSDAIRVQPPFVHELVRGRRPANQAERDIAAWFAELHGELGRILKLLGRPDLAESALSYSAALRTAAASME